MSLITWQERYSVGIPAIDSQRQHLIKLINELHDAMRNGEANKNLGVLLDRLVAYTETHFRTEERLMASLKFPGEAEHHEEHLKLTRQVQALAADFRAGGVALSMPVFKFLKEWLQNHILGSDQKYAEHMRITKSAAPVMAGR